MSVPQYLLYGQPSDGPVDWFLNIEKLSKRCRERGWKIDLHSHPGFAQVMFVLQGGGTMMVQQEVFKFKSPCALVIPVDNVHGFQYEFNTDGWVITLADYCLKQMTSRLPQLNQLWNMPGVCQFDVRRSPLDMICNRVASIQKELLDKSDSYQIIIESDLMSILIELLRTSLKLNSQSLPCTDRQLKLVSAYKALVEESFAKNLKITEFAEMLNVSPFQLRSACETVSRQTPKEILEDRILTEAKRDLIFSSRNIEQIAYRLGFIDPSYFTRFFKRYEGEAPSAFRDAFKGQLSEALVSVR